jgi:AraC-like DNA-binding protein
MGMRPQNLTERLGFSACTYLVGFHRPACEGVCCPLHDHEGIEIVYHAQGDGMTRLFAGPPIAFEQGAAVIYPPRTTHDQVMSRPGMDVCVQMSLAGSVPRVLESPLLVRRVEDPWLVRELEALGSGHPSASPAMRVALAHRSAAVLVRLVETAEPHALDDKSPAEQHAARARHYIDEHFREIGRIEEVARAVGLSPDYVRHTFQRAYGVSPIGYLVRIRMTRAQELLVHSALAHKAIADLCGIDDDKYFARAFRQRVGMTPGSFRRRHRANRIG